MSECNCDESGPRVTQEKYSKFLDVMSQIFTWNQGIAGAPKPNACLYVHNIKQHRTVQITKSSLLCTHKGDQYFSIEDLFDKGQFPQTAQELRECLQIRLDFNPKGCIITINEPDTIEDFSGVAWVFTGMIIRIPHGDEPKAEFILVANELSTNARIKYHMREAAEAQQYRDKLKLLEKTKRKQSKIRKHIKLKRGKDEQQLSQQIKQELWNQCVKLVCEIAGDVLKDKLVVHAGTVLKCIPDNSDFFQLRDMRGNDEFKRLELRQVNGAFQMANCDQQESKAVPESQAVPGIKADPARLAFYNNITQVADLMEKLRLADVTAL